MSVLWIVLPLALIIVGAGVLAFVWAVQGGQMDDLDTPATRVALDDDAPAPHRRGTHDAPRVP